MAEQRTSFEQQNRAVLNAAHILKNNQALCDASETLLNVARLHRELQMPEPDVDRITEIMERMFVRS